MSTTDARAAILAAEQEAAATEQSLIAALAALPADWPITDRTPRPKPAPLVLGPAGFAFTDPTFGSRLWRVTDGTLVGSQSLRTPATSGQRAWNADSTAFIEQASSGGFWLSRWDGKTLTPPVPIAGLYGSLEFSATDP